MGETKAEDRKYRVSKSVLVLLAILMLMVIAAAVYVVPRYGKVFSAFNEQRKLYSAAKTDLSKAEKENAELKKQVEDYEAVKSETDAARDEVYAMAAQLEKDIIDGKSDKKICYITIDDGPYNRGKDFIELFNKYDIKATFFLTTANGDKLPDQANLTARSMYPE